MSKLVSVYIPTHNRIFLVQRAINSVLSQTYKNIEVVIVDDGSTDNTYISLKRLYESFENVVVLKNDKPMGACYSRNKAIRASSGYYVTGLDDDDYFSPDRISNFINSWDEECSALFSDVNIITSDGLNIFRRLKNVSLDLILKTNYVGNQIFTTKDNLLRSGLYDVELPAWQDYDLWIKFISCFGEIRNTCCNDYYWDISHEHERISKSIHKVECARDYLLNKYQGIINNGYNKYFYYNSFVYSGFKIKITNVSYVYRKLSFFLFLKLLIIKLIKND